MTLENMCILNKLYCYISSRGQLCDPVFRFILPDTAVKSVSRQAYYPQIVREKAAEYGFEPNIAFRSADMHLLCSLANQNKGVLICIPVPMTELFKDLRFVPIEDEDMTFSIAFLYQNYEKLGAPEKRFIEFMQSKE